jgi:hypothetical protein
MKRILRARNALCRAATAAAFGAVLFGVSPAQSAPNAPGYLQRKYSLPCTPQCTLCHGSTAGGFGNIRLATQPNGQTIPGVSFIADIEACGFHPTDTEAQWDVAFAQCDAANPKPDADHDGTPDIDELKAGTDPNDASATASICGGGPTYGCVRVARGNSIDGVALFLSGAVFLAGVAFTRRRAKSR